MSLVQHRTPNCFHDHDSSSTGSHGGIGPQSSVSKASQCPPQSTFTRLEVMAMVPHTVPLTHSMATALSQ